MEGLTPLLQLGAEIVKSTAVDAGRTVYNEAIAPELQLTPQQQEAARQRLSYSQQDLLTMVVLDTIQTDSAILAAQNPGRIMRRMLDFDPQIQEDAADLAAIQEELAQFDRQPNFMEPRDGVQQQATGGNSAGGMSLPAIQTELASFIPQSESGAAPIVPSLPAPDAV